MMRRWIGLAAIAAAALLSACVFESAAPLVPAADYATPLNVGSYDVLQRQDNGAFTKDSEAKLSVAKNVYTLTSSDGPMSSRSIAFHPRHIWRRFPTSPKRTSM